MLLTVMRKLNNACFLGLSSEGCEYPFFASSNFVLACSCQCAFFELCPSELPGMLNFSLSGGR